MSDLLDAYSRGDVSCVEVVQGYLDRISAFDQQGPDLRTIITLNPKVLEQAAELDALRRRDPDGVGRLHGIPVVAKDNFTTVDMPTTGGCIAFRHARARRDATQIAKLRDAGALILAKTNLGELGLNGMTRSAVGGQTRNPYDLTRTPGGSSGGSGAALAANFTVLGTGNDSGQSSRSPASANCCVAIRPTRGLVSRHGTAFGGRTQDEAAPLARNIADLAEMLAVVSGYDPLDPITALGVSKDQATYAGSLRADALSGARFGLLTDVMGTEARHADTNSVVERSIAIMAELGATVEPISIPGLDELSADFTLVQIEFREAFLTYLSEFEPGTVDVDSFESFMAKAGSEFESCVNWPLLNESLAVTVDTTSDAYKVEFYRRLRLEHALLEAMASRGLDALLYPHQRCLVASIGEPQLERNGVLSHGSGLPAITFPGGFSPPTESAPLGIPVGVELLGPAWSEGNLLGYAYAFEKAAQVRRPPASTPPL